MERFIRVKLAGKSARAAYVYLPGHESLPGQASKTLSLDYLVEGYKGPRVHLDFSKAGELIGIEILISANENRTPQ